MHKTFSISIRYKSGYEYAQVSREKRAAGGYPYAYVYIPEYAEDYAPVI